MGRRVSPQDRLRSPHPCCCMWPVCRLSRVLRCRYLLVCCLATMVVAVVLLSGPPTSPPPPPQPPQQLIQVRRIQDLPPPPLPPSPRVSSSSAPPVSNNSSGADETTTRTTTTTTTTVVAVTVPSAKNGTNASLMVGEVFVGSNRHPWANSSVPMVYAVTPTYRRLEQQAELTRLAQTLMLVPRLHWIVVEDASQFSPTVRRLLRRSGLNYTHMLGPKPARFAVTPKPDKKSKKKKQPALPRGVSNRLAALRWVQQNVKQGVLYFADDDNSYDVQLFEEMRWTKKVSMWPVGLVTRLAVSSPIVKSGHVVGFYDGWIASRKFPVDMAGFAVNIHFMLQKPNVTMPFMVGYEEDGFLRSLSVTLSDIEPRAQNCTEVLVWHTKTVANKPPKKLTKKEVDKYAHTNVLKLHEIMS